MPHGIPYAGRCQGSSQNLKVLDGMRHGQISRAQPMAIGNVCVLDVGKVRRDVATMRPGQFCTFFLFATTAWATLPQGASAVPRHKETASNPFDPFNRPVALMEATPARAAAKLMPAWALDRQAPASAPLAARGDGGRSHRGTAVPDAGHGAPHQSVRLNANIREAIKQSFVEDGNNLGDRVAEGIVTHLPGWPAERPLWVVRSRADGGHETIRTYPDVQGTGKPVILLLEDNVYFALAEQGSAFGEGERLTEPEDDVQRGNSLYLALQRALFPGQRHAMGLSPADSDDVSRLRDKVAVFSNAVANHRLMARLFHKCEEDACLLYTRQKAPEVRSSTPDASALSCAFAELEKTIGPADARARFVFNIYVHSDVTWTTERIMAERLDWWLSEMSGLLPAGAGLRLRIIRDAPGIADLRYVARPTDERGEGESPNKGYHATRNAISRGVPCAAEADMPREYHLLLTQRRPYSTAKESILGLALDYVAIACLEGANTVGHELGHLIGATHGDAGSMPVGQWQYCVTAMHEWDSTRRLAGLCLSYSDKNRANIRRTLNARMPKPTDPAGRPGRQNNRAPGRSGRDQSTLGGFG